LFLRRIYATKAYIRNQKKIVFLSTGVYTAVMSGPHDPSKKLVTFWASEEEKALLYAAAKVAGFENLADYLRWIAKEQPRPGQRPTSKKRAAKPTE
jgi:nucleoside-diphosphate-sugar epimerase